MATLAILGAGAMAAGASAYAGAQGANATSRAAKAQNEASLRDYYEKRREAMLQEELATATTTNARGDTTTYIPGVGWRENPSATTKALIGATDSEARQRLTNDAIMERLQRGRTNQRQLMEGGLADATLAQGNLGTQSERDIKAALTERNVARAMSGNYDMRKRIGMNALRTGTGAQEALAQLGREGVADTRTAIAEARAEAPGAFVAARGERVNPILNQYGLLAGRATGANGSGAPGTELDGDLAATLRGRMNTAPQAIGSAMSVDAPKIVSQESRLPVSIGGVSSSLMGLANNPDLMARINRLFGSSGGAKVDKPAYADPGAYDFSTGVAKSDWSGE